MSRFLRKPSPFSAQCSSDSSLGEDLEVSELDFRRNDCVFEQKSRDLSHLLEKMSRLSLVFFAEEKSRSSVCGFERISRLLRNGALFLALEADFEGYSSIIRIFCFRFLGFAWVFSRDRF
ncbi:hypothetical protein AAC387_Pa01g0870 [Persea americana]